MHLYDSTVLSTNSYVPFTTIVTNWAGSGTDYLISYDETSRRFIIPFASQNDYYIKWYIALKTSSTPGFPILGLEFSYNNITRYDYIVSPLKTLKVGDTSIYHVDAIAAPDTLLIGLKVTGQTNYDYTLDLNSTTHITASMMILGL